MLIGINLKFTQYLRLWRVEVALLELVHFADPFVEVVTKLGKYARVQVLIPPLLWSETIKGQIGTRCTGQINKDSPLEPSGSLPALEPS